MFTYFVRKFIMKTLCALIPSKKGRLALREKFGFGEVFIPLSKSDSFLPHEVLAKITQKSPLEFFTIHKAQANKATNHNENNATIANNANSSTHILFAPPPIRIFS